MMILSPLRTEDDLRALQAAALKDDHLVMAPSHLVRTEDSEIVGYFGIGNIPLLHCWLDSQRVRARDTVSLAQTTENMLWAAGATVIGCPVSPISPVYPHMARLGWHHLGDAQLHIKTWRIK